MVRGRILHSFNNYLSKAVLRVPEQSFEIEMPEPDTDGKYEGEA